MTVCSILNYPPEETFNSSDINAKDINTTSAFTYVWVIENCSVLLTPEDIVSPIFEADTLENTKWHLELNDINQEYFSWCIHRENDSGPDCIEIIFELEFLSTDGRLKIEELQAHFARGEHLEFEESMDSIFGSRNSNSLTDDTLTFRCRMLRVGMGVPQPNLCFAVTRLGIERRTFFWDLRNFSALGPGQDVRYEVVPMFKEIPPLTLALCVMEVNGKENILVKFLENNDWNLYRFNCEISVLNVSGRKYISKKCTNVSTSSEMCIYFFEKKNIKDESSNLLPNDVLCIRCEFEIGYGTFWNEIEYYLHLPSSVK
ncbi:TD and POZ domain-containing protein 4 [Nephila pilipes]|uniref:TD and POZ domain-containing protein 4 n=1 Tax=Nephila pilipes TaxID=299642 RepID=A0A8X6N8X3_NEPPI|nr:TD and POZ domain-containing protein 4 [Nephila pilipes]